ncbi:MAG: DUF6504 family protein [Anaerolineae bacterium]
MTEFHADEIEVRFEQEPLLEKKPGLPAAFTWQGQEYRIVELLSEWHDYRKRGKTAAAYVKEKGTYWVRASQRSGSWGVGRDYYRVHTDTGEVFDIYYDRKPKGRKRKGVWVLSRKLEVKEEVGRRGESQLEQRSWR